MKCSSVSQVLTPAGKLQSSVELPASGKARGSPGQTALSADGKYAFTTTTLLKNRKEEVHSFCSTFLSCEVACYTPRYPRFAAGLS